MYMVKKFQSLFLGTKLQYSLSTLPNIRKYSSSSINSDVILKTSDDRIKLFKNNAQYDYPHVWLRDNCQCERCFHSKSKSRIIDWKHFDVTVKPAEVSLKDDHVQIIWNDGHKSIYYLSWLKERSFNKADQQKYAYEVYRPKKTPWNKIEFNSVFKKFNYEDVMNDDNSLKYWLQCLNIYGIGVVTNVPKSFKSCRELANRVEFLKRTHYGEEFIVKNKPGTTNVAYLSSNLQLHTDLPYYEYKPGVNLLHCFTQTNDQGGENILTDGLYVVNKMKQVYKENYEILKEIDVYWEDYGEENGNKFHSLYRAPVICENKNNEIVRINYSTPQRGSHSNVSADKIKSWYESLRIFVNLIHEESVSYKVNEGEILCFDNIRLLHGRTQYNDIEDNVRCVIGVYLDWDFINSRMRVLKQHQRENM